MVLVVLSVAEWFSLISSAVCIADRAHFYFLVRLPDLCLANTYKSLPLLCISPQLVGLHEYILEHAAVYLLEQLIDFKTG